MQLFSGPSDQVVRALPSGICAAEQPVRLDMVVVRPADFLPLDTRMVEACGAVVGKRLYC